MFGSSIYFLRSVDGICPDILIKRDQPLILGRGPLTRIKDIKLSRQQVRITWSDSGIYVKQLADNSSYLNTRPLFKGEKAEMSENSILHLVSNRFPFKLILKTDYIISKPAEVNSNSSDERLQDDSAKTLVKVNESKRAEPSPGPGGGSWSFGLLQSMNNPQLKVLEKSDHVVIKDKFPKATHHFLVLPIERIQNLSKLTSQHVNLIRRMVETGWEVADKHPKYNFKLGFHAIPSMSQVHLHVISQDFNSAGLKHKKHWNSFTTDYFINPQIVIDKLVTKGAYVPISKEEGDRLLKSDLKCHICEMQPKNIVHLKSHLLTHL